MTPADILNAAADLIEREGWIQGQGRNDDGARCANEAIFDATAVRLKRYVGAVKAVRLLEKHLGTRSLIAWNDDPSRTKEEVLAALRDAARQTQE